ncbi:MAG: iron-sulfur cluster repair di-iron protein [Fimbriimonadaceae bacterium]|nr:iron-sulfur cluster repair di-iron protein [Chthonomonadaceae bacterium]MCO5295783.1 iron-sulfur cluster repair di-iron protein [Fimbriimonadaceae bacterium]
MNHPHLDRPVGQLVAEQPGRSRVFERWGIDYCCGGKKTLGAVCETKQLDPNDLVRDLETADADPAGSGTDWRIEPLSTLCDHIEEKHHGFLRQALPRLSMLAAKVAERHGERDPRLVKVRDIFEEFRAELESHMLKEERILFPAIRSLEAGQPSHGVAGPIEVMHAEHDHAGADLAAMRGLTDEFRPAADACNTHRALLHALAELEADMHQHVHKENNILFPRAIEKEGVPT